MFSPLMYIKAQKLSKVFYVGLLSFKMRDYTPTTLDDSITPIPPLCGIFNNKKFTFALSSVISLKSCLSEESLYLSNALSYREQLNSTKIIELDIQLYNALLGLEVHYHLNTSVSCDTFFLI